MSNKIPKIIHYCWFGGSEMPQTVLDCISSWKEIMPDYEIKRWDEANYDITKNTYMKEAYEAGKWAFVSDYARLDICNTYGGIYLDTDVEVIKSFDDLLNNDGFCGREKGKNSKENFVATGLVIGLRPGTEIAKILLEDYRERHFVVNGRYNLTPCTKIQTKKLQEYGLTLEDKEQEIFGLKIFPTDYFCPLNQYTGKKTITPKTHSIHLYDASWKPEVDQLRRKLRIEYSKYGFTISNIASTIIAYRRVFGVKRGIFELAKRVIKEIRKICIIT